MTYANYENSKDHNIMDNIDESHHDTYNDTCMPNAEHKLDLKEKAAKLLDFNQDVILKREQVA